MKKIISLFLATIIALTLLTSCANNIGTIGDANAADANRANLSFNERNLEFAFEIFKSINSREAEKNVFISPFSISAALSMTYNGARNTTAQSMAKALKYEGLKLETINESYKNLIERLNSYKDVELDIGNSIWARKGESIKSEFIKSNRDMFGAQVEELDFKRPDAADTINQWISDATNKKIDKMINPPIPDDVIMYLINAIYFKGQWKDQFAKEATNDSKFHMENGSEKDMKMMNRNGEVKYFKGEGFKAVNLSYGNGKTSMYCILPDDGIGINNFISSFTLDNWKRMRKGFKKTEGVNLSIPKFKLEYGKKSLKDELINLGMGESFSDRADFSGIRKDTFISDVLHKAVIEVNEEGSEASGVTVVEAKETCLRIGPEFKADRPMLFMIVDEDSGTILFMGKLFEV